MAEKYWVYANGWGGEIYASCLKDRSWTISFEIDAGEFGRVRETVRNLRSPKQFVHALYCFDGIEMDPQTVESALSELYEHSPTFAIACSICNQTENGEAEFDEEGYLSVFPTFLSSDPPLPPDFEDAKQLGGEMFTALLTCYLNNNLVHSIELNSTTFAVIWNNRTSADLREFQISKAIAEHCRKSEWKKITGHSHAAIGNGQIGQKIRKFVTEFHSEHGSMPIGDFSVDGTAVKFNL